MALGESKSGKLQGEASGGSFGSNAEVYKEQRCCSRAAPNPQRDNKRASRPGEGEQV